MPKYLWIEPVGGPEPRDYEKEPLTRRVLVGEGRTKRDSKSLSPHTLASPERQLPAGGSLDDYRAARKQGGRNFVLWTDPDRSEVFAHVVTVAASRGQATEYEVRDKDNKRLGIIRRKSAKLLPPQRTKWSIHQFNQGEKPAAAAAKGRIIWWFVWLAFSPIQGLVLLLTLFNFEGVCPPRRLRLRRGGQLVLDYHGIDRDLAVMADWWDLRVLTALLVLIRSWETDSNKSGPNPVLV